MEIKKGDVIGKLLILGKDEKRSQESAEKGLFRSYYFVKCTECGASTDKNTGEPISMRRDNILDNKATNRCQCKKTQISHNAKDMIGFVSGYLEVIAEYPESDEYRQKQWICNCKRCIQYKVCDNPKKDNIVVSGYNLRAHKVNSCGNAHYGITDLRGKKIGLLRVRNELPYEYDKNSVPYWVCDCEGWKYGFENCKRTILVRGDQLKKGKIESCGCNIIVKRNDNGTKRDKLMNIWIQMMARCSSHKNYADRGIKVCDRWKDPDTFISDNIDKYEPGLSIDRIDVNGDYEPDNCRWVDITIQANNKTNNTFVNIGDTNIKVTVAQYERLYRKHDNIPASMVAARIREGWSPEEAIQIPKLSEKDPVTGKQYKNKEEWLAENKIIYNMVDFIDRIEKEKNVITDPNTIVKDLPEDYPEDTSTYTDDPVDISFFDKVDLAGFDLTTIENYGPFKKIIYIGSKNSKGMYRVIYTDGTHEDIYRKALIERIKAFRRGEELPGHKKTYKNILGQRFGKLTVIRSLNQEEVERRKLNKSRRGHWWECKCDCGNPCFYTTHELTKGIFKSCGCSHTSPITYCGRETTIRDLTYEMEPLFHESVKKRTFANRIRAGWSAHEAMCIPCGVDKDTYRKDNNIRSAVIFDESLKDNTDNELGFKFTITD